MTAKYSREPDLPCPVTWLWEGIVILEVGSFLCCVNSNRIVFRIPYLLPTQYVSE